MSLFKRKKKEEAAPEHLYNNDEMLFARLLLETNPQFDDTVLLREIGRQFSQVEAAPHDRGDARQYFFRDYMASFKEGFWTFYITLAIIFASVRHRSG